MTWILSVVLAVTGAAVPAAAPGGVVWSPCADPALAGMECATLEVPVDWADPEGRRIVLDLGRAPATGPSPDGSVLVNVGGPGIRGVQWVARALDNFAGLRARMDVVTWNPRGGDGRYLPVAECSQGPAYDVPRDEAEYAAAAAAGWAAMQPCRDADPALFDHLDSATQARDMDAIRAALGEEQVNYLGSSYGGVLGASYARLFPDRVRTMFVDSIIEHVSGPVGHNRANSRGVEELFGQFVAWCAEEAECALHGRDAGQAWRDLRAAAAQQPVPVLGADPPATVDAELLTFLAIGPIVHPEAWPEFAAAIVRGEAGDAGGFTPDGQPPVFAAAALATLCADGFRFTDHAEYAAARAESVALFPNVGGDRDDYTAMCAGWPAPVANPPGPLPSAELPPLLGAGPALELGNVRAMTEQVPGSVVLTFATAGHGLYLNEGNRCVIEHADRYLTDAVLPAGDLECPPNPAELPAGSIADPAADSGE
jgi:pimeloyl-ACP methyl ester carboxylesterase